MSDQGIRTYVDSIDFAKSDVFAVFDDALHIAGAVHLGYGDESAELGLSVLAEARGKGIGNALFTRATVHLSNRFIRSVYMHCLRENAVILHLARKNGMSIVMDGSEADAHLSLPKATPETVASEWMAATLALIDYRLKVGANATRDVLATIAS